MSTNHQLLDSAHIDITSMHKTIVNASNFIYVYIDVCSMKTDTVNTFMLGTSSGDMSNNDNETINSNVLIVQLSYGSFREMGMKCSNVIKCGCFSAEDTSGYDFLWRICVKAPAYSSLYTGTKTKDPLSAIYALLRNSKVPFVHFLLVCTLDYISRMCLIPSIVWFSFFHMLVSF